jgi:hypothetical protein
LDGVLIQRENLETKTYQERHGNIPVISVGYRETNGTEPFFTAPE